MHSKPFHAHFTVQEKHLDVFNHMNNAVYLTLFEQARWDLITQNGFGIEKIKETQLAPTILEVRLSFLKELKLGDAVDIETKLLLYKNKIGRLSQQMIRSGEVCCDAEFTIALFDLRERKLVYPTKEWLHAIGVDE